MGHGKNLKETNINNSAAHCCLCILIFGGGGLIITIVLLTSIVFIPLAEYNSAISNCNNSTDIEPIFAEDICLEKNCYNNTETIYAKLKSHSVQMYTDHNDELLGTYYNDMKLFTIDKEVMVGSIRLPKNNIYNRYEMFQCDEDKLPFSIEVNVDAEKYNLYYDDKLIVQSVNDYWKNITDIPDITLVDIEDHLVCTIYIDYENIENLWKVTNFQPIDYPNWILLTFPFLVNLD